MKEQFVEFSAEVTGFTAFELFGTGMADTYLDEVVTKRIGADRLRKLLAAYSGIKPVTEQKVRTSRMRREIFGDEELGPIARNIIKLWYLGIWEALPQGWVETYGPIDDNKGFTVNASAYVEGLLWVAIGANPPGAKAPGYGSWAHPPEIPAF
jgi:hypothetical protein